MTSSTQIRIPEDIRIGAGLEPGQVYKLAVIIDSIERADPTFQGIYRRRAIVEERRRLSSQKMRLNLNIREENNYTKDMQEAHKW
jgi:bifunctional DNA-binding transcriptional regulator/antitoxin component of YhaV-PrlF toxin-antitoxin module